MKPTGTRQSGRHNESKEKRKSNRKHRKDIIELDKEIKDAKAIDGDILPRVPMPASNGNNSVSGSNLIDNSNHIIVEAERPQHVSWHLRQLAATPGRSYLKKKDD